MTRPTCPKMLAMSWLNHLEEGVLRNGLRAVFLCRLCLGAARTRVRHNQVGHALADGALHHTASSTYQLLKDCALRLGLAREAEAEARQVTLHTLLELDACEE